MITIQELLRLKTDLFDKSKVKIIRHKDNRKEYRDIINDRDELLEYQRNQSENVFGNCEYIISFIGTESTKALFFGIFKINGIISETENNGKKEYLYDITEVKGFDDYINRVIIDWGKSVAKWHHWYDKNPKDIVEILPKGFIGSFPGLTNFVLEFKELKTLIENPDANRDWKNHLSSVNGIYIILDKKTGNQYIGSANGKNGIWQRWSDYAKNYHGGNTELIKLIEKDNKYYKNFKYSVLQTLPSNISKKEIGKIETIYKEKLGTKVHGLNNN
jgi:hypothetical protein